MLLHVIQKECVKRKAFLYRYVRNFAQIFVAEIRGCIFLLEMRKLIEMY